MEHTVTITFEGRTIVARHGESVAAALTAAGVTVFRRTRSGAERGMFCGMGVCQDCLVRIDGKANQRACMVKVDAPMRIERETDDGSLESTNGASLPPVTSADVPVRFPDVLVLGAGPGGLGAAIAARACGASVTVLDERAGPGGQYYKQPAVHGAGLPPPDAQAEGGRALIAAARAAGAIIESGHLAWGAFAPRTIVATGPDGTRRYEPRALVVATGAYERGWPVPGWTLPGVITTGAAQTLWRTARRLPGRRVLIAGNGPLNLQLAAELLEGGGEIAAIVEAARRPGTATLGAALRMALLAPALVRDGLRYHLRRLRAGVPMLHGAVLASVERTDRGLLASVKTLADGTQRQFSVDAVCLGYGFEPANEILRALDCAHDFDRARGHLVTQRDADGATTVAGVFALGDCTGLGGAQAARAEGVVVGHAAARHAGHAMPAPRQAVEHAARAALGRQRAFQAALWHLFASGMPTPLGQLTRPDTLICRCEEVSLGRIEAAIAAGATSAGAVKQCTRAGMGRCQGRYCGPIVDALTAHHNTTGRDEFSGFAPRLPVKPVAIADLVRLAGKP